MKTAIVNVNLEYNFNDSASDKEIIEKLHNIELPREYVEDSFELVKIINEDN